MLCIACRNGVVRSWAMLVAQQGNKYKEKKVLIGMLGILQNLIIICTHCAACLVDTQGQEHSDGCIKINILPNNLICT